MDKQRSLIKVIDELSIVTAKIHIMHATLQYLVSENSENSEEVKKISFGSSLLFNDIVDSLNSLEKKLEEIRKV